MRQIKDPAPSRLAYRLNRLMLRPWVRRFLIFGLPVLVMASLGVLWASDEARVGDALDRLSEIRRQVEERPEFMVRMMAVENATPRVASDVREVLSMDFPISSFDLELAELRARVETLDAVAEASVRIRTGGVLEIEVAERKPVVIWRSDGGLVLLDATGHLVATIPTRAERSDLPLIAGAGADRRVSEAIALYAVAEPIRNRLRGFLRVGERRWDVVLDRDQRIMLPEETTITALKKVIELDVAQDLLGRNVSSVDFRNPRRPVLRLGDSAVEGLYETNLTADGDVQK